MTSASSDLSPEQSTMTSVSGGVGLAAGRDVSIGGDVVGRDKIVQNINHIITHITQRPLTAIEESEQARSVEVEHLRQGMTAYIRRLQDRVSESAGSPRPYKGLLEYRLSDAAIFFGRTRAVADLNELVQCGPLAVLHAESGAGKTSLLLAGISPRLIAAGHLPVYLRPYNLSPSFVIKRALVTDLRETPTLAQASLRNFLMQVNQVLGPETTLYLCLDQFEEFFTLLEETGQARFVEELAECLDDPSLNVRWILALRSEFFGNLATFRPRIRNPFENDYRLNRLTRAEAYAACVEPAAQAGVAFEDGLIEAVLDDLGKEEVAPPQVQLVCSALYEALPPDSKAITRRLYEEQHGAEGILREHLSRVLHRDLPAEQRPIAQYVLEALITSEVHRVLRTRAELTTEPTLRDTKPAILDQVLNQLVDSRLLRVEEVDDQTAYELAHDYLLTEIKLDPAVQARKAAQELLDQEVRAYRRYGTLLSDDKLAILAPRRRELVLDDDGQALLRKSERALKRRQRLAFGGIGLVIALIIVGALSIVAAIDAEQRQQAAIEFQRTAEAAAAEALVQKDSAIAAAATAQALQLSSENAASSARSKQATAEAGAAIAVTREAAANAFAQLLFERTHTAPLDISPRALAYDGKQLWAAGEYSAESIDPVTGRTGTPIKAGGYYCCLTALAFDGSRLWIADGGNWVVQSLDLTTQEVSGTPIDIFGEPSALFFDGTRVWVAGFSDRGTVQFIDPTTRQISEPITVDGFPTALAFDGTRLWVANKTSNTVQAIDPTTGQVVMTVKVGASPSALAVADNYVWVANAGDDTVQSIDPATGHPGQSIQVGITPIALVFDGTRLLVVTAKGQTVQAIYPHTGKIGPTSLPTGHNPAAMTLVGDSLWIANTGDAAVSVTRPADCDISPRIAVDVDLPMSLAFDGTRLWTADFFGTSIQSINAQTGERGPHIQLTTRPYGPPIDSSALVGAIAFDGTHLWDTSIQDETVRFIDPVSGKVNKSIAIGEGSAAVTFDGLRLWVAYPDRNTVQAIDITTRQAGIPITVGAHPAAFAFDGAQLWVAHRDDNTVQIIDTTTNRIRATIAVGANPSALAYDGTYVWVANAGNDTVQSIDTKTLRPNTPIQVGRQPSAFAFDGGRVYVSNEGDGTIQLIDPRTDKSAITIATGIYPTAMAFDGTRLWIVEGNTVRHILINK